MKHVLVVGLSCIALGLGIFALSSGREEVSIASPDAGADLVAMPSPSVPPDKTAAERGADAGTEALVITGRVLRSGEVAAGATVKFGAYSAETNGAGEFRLEILKTSADGYLFASRGTERSAAAWLNPDAPPLGEVVLSLRPSRALRGVVKGRDTGVGIANAKVELRQNDRSVQTSADGSFVIEAVSATGTAELRVAAEGYVRNSSRVEMSEEYDAQVHIELERGATVTGRVVDSRSEGIPGAQLFARRLGGETEDAKAVSGPRGEFTLTGLLPRPYNIQVEADGYGRVSHPVEAPASEARIVLELGTQVEGVIQDGAGKPVAEVQLHLTPQLPGAANRQKQSTTSGADGRFAFESFGAGPWTLKYWRYTHLRTAVEELQLEFVAGERRELSLTLSVEKGFFEARVVDAASLRAVADASASVTCKPDGYAQSETDDDGRFELSGVDSAEGACTLKVQHEGHLTFTGPLASVAKSGDIKLLKGSSIKGRVVDEQNVPLTDFVLDDEQRYSADGRFLKFAEPGKRTVTLSTRYHLPVVREVEVREGEAVDLGDVQLVRGATVTIAVRGPDGRPVPGAGVFVVGRGSTARSQIEQGEATALFNTGANGEGSTPMKAGSFCFVARKHPHAVSTIRGCPMKHDGKTASRFELLLPAGAWVEGVVRTDGQPVMGALIKVKTEELSAVSGRDGRYRLGPLNAGKVDLGVMYEPAKEAMSRVALRSVEVAEGKTLTIDFVDNTGPEIEIELRSRLPGKVLIAFVNGHFSEKEKPKETPDTAARLVEIKNGAATVRMSAQRSGAATVVFARLEGTSMGKERYVQLTLPASGVTRVMVDLDNPLEPATVR